MIQAALIKKFQSEDNNPYIILLYIETIIEFITSAIILFMLILATFFLFILRGLEYTIPLVFFVALSLLCANWCIKSVFRFAGADLHTFAGIKEEMETKIKTSDDYIKFIKMLLDKKE